MYALIYLFIIFYSDPYSPSLMQISLIEACSNIQPTKITSFGVFWVFSPSIHFIWFNCFCFFTEWISVFSFFTLTSGCWSETVWCNNLQLMRDGVQCRQSRGQFPAHPVPPALPRLHQICGKHPSLPSVSLVRRHEFMKHWSVSLSALKTQWKNYVAWTAKHSWVDFSVPEQPTQV